MKVEIKNFKPEVIKGQAKEFVTKALDWYSENSPREEEKILENMQISSRLY
jgi:hypothetical protein